jgi:hypothetical protein
MRSYVAAVCAVLLLASCSSDDADPGADTPAPSTTPSEAPRSPSTPPTYVALGDSYTAAPGVPETERESGCSRSSANYPSLVAEQLDLVLADVSCSGADTLALVGSQETDRGPVPPQFLALVPGVEVVTLGMGGNDEDLFSDLVRTCLTLASDDPTGEPCRDAMATPGGGDEAEDRIEVIGTRLTSALTGVLDRLPDAAVVLVGYPQLVPELGRCDALPLADGDYAYVRALTEKLGAATAKAAKDAGVLYADVLAASEGHDVCAGADAWVNGIGNSDGRAAAPLHPFAEEQVAVADIVVALLAGRDSSAT